MTSRSSTSASCGTRNISSKRGKNDDVEMAMHHDGGLGNCRVATGTVAGQRGRRLGYAINNSDWCHDVACPL